MRLRLISLIGMLCMLFEAELVLASQVPTGLINTWKQDNSAETKVARKRKKGRRRRKKRKARARQRVQPAVQPEVQTQQAPAEPAVSSGATHGRSRVDFDAMNIKGQTTKAGEVQILERKDNELKSMVNRRTSFRDEIIQTVFPEKADSL